MSHLVRRVSLQGLQPGEDRELLTREWLVTNGLGGYASGTVSGVATRRYHGMLIAAHPAPLGRRMVFSHLSERMRLPQGDLVTLSGEPYRSDDLHRYGADHLVEFRLELGLPIWRFEVAGITLERQILLAHQQNTVYIIYRMLAGEGPVRLKLLLSMHNRAHDDPVNAPLPSDFHLEELDGHYELHSSPDLPTLRIQMHGRQHAFTVERRTVPEVLYQVEESRGYDHRGVLWSPGYFRLDLSPDEPAALVASTEPWEQITSLAPSEALEAERERRLRRLAAAHEYARQGLAAELVLAADQFIIKPVGRAEDAVRVRAEGDQVRTVIAGYHWFTDWGRDTMISLEGLTLATGRYAEAGSILRMFASFIRDGLLPNLFPEGERQGLYHTADATLWFFHAIDRYLQATDDRITLQILLPRLIEIAEHHLRGTRFGIAVDPQDGLLRQGEEGYQLTWMDAKVGDWVVTPRRGKAVEINALWYNAMRLLAGWVRQVQGDAQAERWSGHAQRTFESFNRRFWFADGGYLYDVVDGERGDDASLRPNQLMAISLTHPVLERSRWEPVLQVVEQRLLTPVGLRSLAPGHPDYRQECYGDLRARDAAYHQGTVWAWLIGPFVDAWLKAHPADPAGARRFLAGFDAHLSQACVGQISEIFDAESPFTPRGCIAQAWSVAEVLRCWLKTHTTSRADGESKPA